MARVGRNDPCPCGSGRKYKMCCLSAEAGPTDLLWHRLRHAIADLTPTMLAFARRQHGESVLDRAWRDFMLDRGSSSFSPNTPHVPVFFPWVLYHWRPRARADGGRYSAGAVPVGRAFLDSRPRLDPLATRYVQACLEVPFSFHEVLEVTPGTGFRLRDVVTGAALDVTERSASRDAQPGEIIYGTVIPFDHIALVDGCSPVRMPAGEKVGVVALRARLREGDADLDAAALRRHDAELRRLYISVTERLLNPRMPLLRNTDGEELSMQRITWDIPSAQQAFDVLAPLATGDDDVGLPDDAVISPAGALEHVEFPWLREGNAQHATWTNTVLGTFRIDGRRLTVEVNSAERADLVRQLVDAALPDAVHRGSVVESIESALDAFRTAPAHVREARARESDELNADPELRAQMADFLGQHYRAWVDAPLPALGGRTPREAVATADGREMVEALLVDFERDRDGQLADVPTIIAEVRETLLGTGAIGPARS